MTIFDNVLFSVVFIIFPLSIWIIYQIYAKNLDHEADEIGLDICIISMIYLMFKLTNIHVLYFSINVPFILAFKNKRKTLFISLCIFYAIFSYENMAIVFIQIISYLIFYFKLKKKNKFQTLLFINLTTLFSTINLIVDHVNIISIFWFVLMFESIVIITLLLLKKASNMIYYSNILKELEDEKQLRNSIFKITHEIKNPIAVVKGYLDMFDVNNIEHSKKYIPILKKEVSKVLTLLQDFLSIRNITIEKETVDIYYLMENVIDTIKPLLNEKNIKLDFELPDDELYIDVDYNRINQVIINLIKNAMEAMKNSKEKYLKILLNKGKKNINISIIDSGNGISKENLRKMKNTLFSTKATGSGIGVFLSNEIIKKHDGNLTYISKENKGTKVTISLPLKKDIIFN